VQQRIPILALAAALVLAAPLAAQLFPTGPEIPVHDQPLEGTLDTAIAAGSDGGFLAVWNNSAGAVLARAFGPGEVPRSATASLVRPARQDHGGTSAAGPKVAAIRGGYAVAWESEFPPGTPHYDPSLSFRLLDASGQPTGPEITAVHHTAGSAIAATPSGGFLLAWVKATTHEVLVRRLDALGVTVGNDVLVTGASWPAALASLPDGSFAITWRGGPSLQIFGPDGAPRTAVITVPGTPGPTPFEPRISADATGRFVVTLGAQTWFFAPTGILLAAPPPVSTGLVAPYDVAMRGDGSFLLAWQGGSGIQAQGYTADHRPQGEKALVPTLDGSHLRPAVAATSRGWLVSWVRRTGGESLPYVRSFVFGDCGGKTVLCLREGRFRVEVTWHIPSTDARGAGTPIPRTDDTGAFWFFTRTSYELGVKVLDGQGINRHFWVFYTSLTDVEFDLTVTDLFTAQKRTYHNPAGTMASKADTEAF